MKPSGAGAVMADRARGEVAGDDARTALYRRLEFFPTPPWAARAGGELIKRLDPLAETCWEPACGEGHMAYGLADYFHQVEATDVHDHGFGWSCVDFLAPDASPDAFRIAGDVDWIVTNPPFATAAQFVRLGLSRARRGVAILARASFMESAGRYPLFFGDQPLSVYAPFFERVPMQLGRWEPGGSTATAYAWFVWDKAVMLQRFAPRVHAIAPGTRERLSRPEDARRFAPAASAPLLDGGGA
jgi:hypothetical protein